MRRFKLLVISILLILVSLWGIVKLVAQVHQSDPPAVFRTTVKDPAAPSRAFTCYSMPVPGAVWCDVVSPATGKRYVVAFQVPGGAIAEVGSAGSTRAVSVVPE